MRTLVRYCLLQLPGTVLVAAILYVLWAAGVIGTGLASVLFGLAVLKDALLYPLYRPVLEKPLPPAGAQALVGQRATARTDIAGHGLVHVQGELWQAQTGDGTHIPAGASVRVVAAHGLRLTVECARHDSGDTGERIL
jgi:membrane-bound serine protease (ClpP class)